MTLTIIDMPAFWASYLINGDASGLEDGEKAHIGAYLKTQGIRSVLDCAYADESFFSWSFGLHGGTSEGGDLLEYTAELLQVSQEPGT